MNKETVEKMVSSARDEAGKVFQSAKEIVTEENVQKAKDFAKGLGTQKGREKAAESARQAAKTSRTWLLAFWNDVKNHFKPDENLSGVAAWKSRFRNLWLCGLNGKIAIMVLGVVVFSTVKVTLFGDRVDCNFSGYTDSTGVVVKGLYAGMPKKACIKQMEYLGRKYGLKCFCEDNKNGSTSVYLKSTTEGMGVSIDTKELEVEIDAQGITTDIEFGDGAINLMFNAGDMTLKQFAQALANKYHIPELEGRYERNPLIEKMSQTIYHYEDSAGRSVDVSESRMHGAGLLDCVQPKSLKLSYRHRTFD